MSCTKHLKPILLTPLLKIKRLLTILLTALLLYACDRDDGGGTTPPPEPPSPPNQEEAYVRKELRGAWIASVWNIDWPLENYSVEGQKKIYTDYLDGFVSANLNAVFMQIRPTADAFYNSQYESWSKWITGEAGKDPGYDVLQFMVEQAHVRGLEFHAWLNPYRIAFSPFPPLDPNIPAEWVKDYSNIRVYNPAIPEVQQRIADIVKEIITKYDVDGIHFDDYFYPEVTGGVSALNDAAEYAKYGAGYSSIADFRRANVDKVIQKIRETILKENPRVVFSISPNSDVSANLNTLFANIEKWCREGWIDVVIPQIYQPLGSGNSNFEARLSSWIGSFNTNVGCVIGFALYRVVNPSESVQFTVADFERQFQLAMASKKVHGSLLYNTSSFAANRGGVIDMLKSTYYKHPAVRPSFGRQTAADPVIPSGLTLSGTTLSWTAPAELTSVVYLTPAGSTETQVAAITKSRSFLVTVKGKYFVTTFNRENVESKKSNEVVYN